MAKRPSSAASEHILHISVFHCLHCISVFHHVSLILSVIVFSYGVKCSDPIVNTNCTLLLSDPLKISSFQSLYVIRITYSRIHRSSVCKVGEWPSSSVSTETQTNGTLRLLCHISTLVSSVCHSLSNPNSFLVSLTQNTQGHLLCGHIMPSQY